MFYFFPIINKYLFMAKRSLLSERPSYNIACCLYGCETWLLTLREEHRLRVFENRVLRRIFGPKQNEVTG